MAINQRSMTGELLEGATDGTVKKTAPNWSNRVHDITDSGRSALSHVEGGFDWSPHDGDNHAVAHGIVRGV